LLSYKLETAKVLYRIYNKITVVFKHDNFKLLNECHNYNTRQRETIIISLKEQKLNLDKNLY